MTSPYKRVLLKLSGEQLGNDLTLADGTEVQVGFSPERASWIAQEVKKVTEAGIQVVITIGGGNFVRGADLSGYRHLISPTVADQAGIMATSTNAMLLEPVFQASDVPTRAMSKLDISAFIDSYTYRRAIHDLNKGRVVIIGGGSGQTGFTSDMGALNAADSLHCDLVIKATKVDGIYDKDPAKFPDAVRFDSIDYDRAITDPNVRVMDKAALGMAADKKIPIIVLELLKKGNILKAALGEPVGTIVS